MTNDAALHEAMISGRARVAITIPPDYSDRLLKGGGAQVLVMIDGSDSSISGQATNVSTSNRLTNYPLNCASASLALPIVMPLG